MIKLRVADNYHPIIMPSPPIDNKNLHETLNPMIENPLYIVLQTSKNKY